MLSATSCFYEYIFIASFSLKYVDNNCIFLNEIYHISWLGDCFTNLSKYVSDIYNSRIKFVRILLYNISTLNKCTFCTVYLQT